MYRENYMSERVSQRFLSLMLRAAFFFEPLAPRAISYFLTRKLKELKEQGLISEFKTKIRRLGKFHYRIEIDFDLTEKQTNYVLDELLPNQLKSVRRWVNV
jgi:hypothetical protein